MKNNNSIRAFALFLLIALIGFALFPGCVDHGKNPPPVVITEEAPTDIFACEVKSLPPGVVNKDAIQTRGVGYRGHYWAIGQTVTVGFVGTANLVREAQVRQFLPAWAQWAFLNIRFVSADSASLADIRVAFAQNGNWSYIGSDARYVSRQAQTMNIGQNDPTGRIIRHEAGHGIGLKHEQSHPIGICWNRPVVYADALRMYGWPPAMVDNNILNVSSAATHDITPFDTMSVMLYDIIRTWTFRCTGPNCTDCVTPGPAYKGGTVISQGDILTAKTIYPGRGTVQPPTGTGVTLTAAQVAQVRAALNASVTADSVAYLRGQAARQTFRTAVGQ